MNTFRMSMLKQLEWYWRNTGHAIWTVSEPSYYTGRNVNVNFILWTPLRVIKPFESSVDWALARVQINLGRSDVYNKYEAFWQILRESTRIVIYRPNSPSKSHSRGNSEGGCWWVNQWMVCTNYSRWAPPCITTALFFLYLFLLATWNPI